MSFDLTRCTLRRLGPEDVEALLALETACFSQPWSREAYEKELGDNPLAFYVGCFDGPRLIGFGGFWLIVDEAHITNVAVDAAFRRRHVGALLLQAMRALAGQLQARLMTLEVRVGNTAALALYRRCGFVEVGRRPRYYEEPTEDALLLTCYFDGAAPSAPERE